jgi:hypothetical protein
LIFCQSDKQVSKLFSNEPSKQARKPIAQQPSKQASKQASKLTSQQSSFLLGIAREASLIDNQVDRP